MDEKPAHKRIKPAVFKKVLFFAESMAEICARTRVAQGRPLRWIIIANPTAGGFTLPAYWKKHRPTLEQYVSLAKASPKREDCGPAGTATGSPALADRGLVVTERAGSGMEIAGALVNEATGSPGNGAAPFYLVIVAGGDGTSLEVLSVLFGAPESVRSNMAILRLPMGTGNDGADSPDLAKALDLLTKPTRIEFTPALRLLTSPGGRLVSQGPFIAFNVLSVGIDAFVTHMTNKMKKKSPGDFYKLWVDIAALLYDKLYTVGFLDVKALDEHGGEVLSFREKLLLVAVGISGHRTYGSRKKILPDDRNVCALKQMSLLRKLALKELFSTGGHVEKPEATLFNAQRVEFRGDYPLLAQMDGETVLLDKKDFPAAIELTAPAIPVLRLACCGT
ncbi:MAG: diacylglycerol kinase [Treponema sp.]|nr:diacylglycerol kinase [Treponema sp.]